MHKTALVTGGTGGLGAAVTARLLDHGWHVVAVIAHLLSADADATSGAAVPVYGRA
jgi:NAD(P)-dependent dehydrogenase (short-subunit alcohol dehydrogenase family)